ncbi:hypothetical protein G7077_02660 [Sphingomonas piscis]|uniref:Uncharacterized protein n=1 Tax=Sphingomonas piscis TaxID=2714943 RepID=A0A6G7YMM9_9SPHN|nr:hypothetical protein [Sphingomonas piscis]QIK77976.1 hypothetical protein G7077_02660 [Sphingomonas piscis]
MSSKSKPKSPYITATHPQRGTLWAAVDPDARNLEGRVEDLRFGAYLAPFKSAADAEAALRAAGGQLEVSHG